MLSKAQVQNAQYAARLRLLPRGKTRHTHPSAAETLSYFLSVPALVSNTRSASIAIQKSCNLTQRQEVVPPNELAILVMPLVFIMSDLRLIYHGDLAEPVTASPANHRLTSSMLLDNTSQWVFRNGLAILQISSWATLSSCCWLGALCTMRDAIFRIFWPSRVWNDPRFCTVGR